MTTKQRIKLMSDLWPTVARANGWDPHDRAQRLAIINAVLACHPHPARRRKITSASELDSDTDYTLVKNRLLMLVDSLDAAGEDGDLVPNALRQRREVIRRLIKQLADYLAKPSPHQSDMKGAAPGENFPKPVARDEARNRVPPETPSPSPPSKGGEGRGEEALRVQGEEKEKSQAIMRAERYALKIIHDTTARAGFEPDCFARATFEQVLSALDLFELNSLIITLKKRLQSKRNPRRLPA
jgi:hypothetical protein